MKSHPTTLLGACVGLMAAAQQERLPVADATPLLIEGSLIDTHLQVVMPEGDTWRYNLMVSAPSPLERRVMVMIDRHKPGHACVFQPSIEGIHPFVGVANRFGVEKEAADA
jgi:hypothetical protein